MTPDALLEIAKVAGVPGAILIYMWMNRNPAPKEQGDPAKQLLAKLDAMEDRIIAVDTKIEVLLDRRK